MFDESVTNQFEDWLELFGFYLSNDDLTSISSSEKTQALCSVLSNRVRPKETVKLAKLLSLNSKLIKLRSIDMGSSQSDKELGLLKTRTVLKGQLKQKEKQYAEQKEACMELIKENEELIRKTQWMNSVLSDENKKLLFLKLNSKALDSTLEIYCSLRQSISKVLQFHKTKKEEKSSKSLNAQILEAVRECHEHVLCSKRKIKEQLKIVDCISSEYGHDGKDSTSMNWKSEMLENVTEKLENFPRNQVFQALLEILHQQIISIQSLSESICKSTLSDSARYSERFDNVEVQVKLEKTFLKNCCGVLSEVPAKKAGETLQEQVQNKLQMSSSNMQLLEKSVLVKKLKMVENQLQDLDKCIQERVEECKNLKTRMTVNIKEMKRRMYFIKHFSTKLKPFEEKHLSTMPQLDELCNLMNQFCAAGPNEIRLFATMPLVATEKLTLANEKIPIYELTSSYLKVISSSNDEYSSPHLSMLKDATSLEPHDLLLHVWKQLSFLSLLFKTYSFMKPFVGSHEKINFESHLLDEESKKMEFIQHEFLSLLATYDFNADNVTKLLNALEMNPLTSVVPSDILVHGLPMEEYIKLFKKVDKDESNQIQNSVCDARDSFENI